MNEMDSKRKRDRTIRVETCPSLPQGYPDKSVESPLPQRMSMENGNYTVAQWTPSKIKGPQLLLAAGLKGSTSTRTE